MWLLSFEGAFSVTTVKLVTIVIWVALVVFGISYTYKYRQMLSWLREKHSQKWNQLGRPALLWGSSAKSTFQVLSFLKSRDYLSLSDSQLNQICSSVWNIFRAYVVLFLLAIIMGFAVVTNS